MSCSFNKSLRLLEVWKIYSDGQVHRTKVVAEMLACSPKTVQREIETLRDLGCDFISNRNGLGRMGLKLQS